MLLSKLNLVALGNPNDDSYPDKDRESQGSPQDADKE